MSLTKENRCAVGDIQGLERKPSPWPRVFAIAGIFVALAAVLALYYVRTFSGLTEPDQMDIAQIARSVSSGNGFTTRFVRPFNAGLMSDATAPLPEVNHGPSYPYAIAAVFKVKGISDHVVVWMSMVFMYVTLVGTYFLGRVLFDWRTGAFAAIALGVSASVLDVGVGATEWSLAAFLFLLLTMSVALHHKCTLREDSRSGFLYPVLAAIFTALLFMTHHVLIFLGVPIALYFAVTGQKRRLHFAIYLLVLVVAATPWAYRNAATTGGSIIGANAWDIMADTKAFPDVTFYRTIDKPSMSISSVLLFPLERFSSFSQKLMSGTVRAVGDGILMLGLMLPFAFVSALYRFRQPTANAIRGLTYGLLPALCLCIALFSLKSDALLVVAPVVAVFGSAYLFLLLDARKLHPIYARAILVGIVLLMSWSALTTIVWGGQERSEPLGEVTQLLGHGDELGVNCLYTDVPWLGAWRTQRMIAVWLPRTDNDVVQLTLEGLDMKAFVLSSEVRSYSPDEVWHRLYTTQMQRDYVEKPDETLERVRRFAEKTGRSSQEAEIMKTFFRQSQRNAEVFDSIKGFKRVDLGPYASDEVQIYESNIE